MQIWKLRVGLGVMQQISVLGRRLGSRARGLPKYAIVIINEAACVSKGERPVSFVPLSILSTS